MLCAIHKKEMKVNARGFYCSTPMTKSADGTEVLEWCQWKPGVEATGTAPVATTNPDTATTKPETDESGPDWEAIRAEKNMFIARQVAYKGAIELRAAGILKDDQFWDVVQKHTNRLLSEPTSARPLAIIMDDNDVPDFGEPVPGKDMPL